MIILSWSQGASSCSQPELFRHQVPLPLWLFFSLGKPLPGPLGYNQGNTQGQVPVLYLVSLRRVSVLGVVLSGLGFAW